MSLSLIKHLLPRAKAWILTLDSQMRQFFDALSESIPVDVREFFDLLWLDMFPETTRELTQWEAAFGLKQLDLTTAERRTRLTGLWTAQGGQDPRYIQDTLRAAGFDVYVHEWWVLPAGDPPVARNPFDAIAANPYGCNDPELECGDYRAECGNAPQSDTIGYPLVNKLYTAELLYTAVCGDDSMECGEPLAECGENDGIIFDRVVYDVPDDPDLWPYIMYIGGPSFGDIADIAASRMDEFEDLCLKICPTHLWIGLMVRYVSTIIEDATGYDVIEDASSDLLVE